MIIKTLKAVKNSEDETKFDVTIQVFANANDERPIQTVTKTVADVKDATIETLLDGIETIQKLQLRAEPANQLTKEYTRTVT